MPTHITATQAMRSFSDLLNQVHYQGKSFEIKRGKEFIAMLTPSSAGKGLKISALNDFFEHLPSLDEKDAADFAKDIHDIRVNMGAESDSWD